jgi:imidazole glycerol-phosphate synthase subunit HisH
MRRQTVGILDYGSGNTGSVHRAMMRISDDVRLCKSLEELELCSHLILPGVGNFVKSKSLLEEAFGESGVNQIVSSGKPFLGICVGMQLLATTGFETRETTGFNVIPGTINKIRNATRLPHVGWNNLENIKQPNPLLMGVSHLDDFYFVHSYAYDIIEPEFSIAETHYGSKFTSVVQRENVFGVQFHPEKSGKAGQAILRNFLSL